MQSKTSRKYFTLSLYGVFPGLFGQFSSVTYPRRTGRVTPSHLRLDHVNRNELAARNNEVQGLGREILFLNNHVKKYCNTMKKKSFDSSACFLCLQLRAVKLLICRRNRRHVQCFSVMFLERLGLERYLQSLLSSKCFI